MFVRKILLGLGLLFALSGAALAQSPVGQMEGFYEKSKGTLLSVTEAGAYKSQTRYAVTGGSYVWRAPQENATLVNAQLPSISAGCGGIDIYAGSFSFINGEQLESLFRAILQDAAGFAFHLAIKEISHEIEDSLSSLTNIMNMVNGQNINSCEAAQALVKNTIAVANSKKTITCAVKGTAAGIFPDALSGRTCGDDENSELSGDKSKEMTGDNPPTNQNYAMRATENSAIKDELDLREFYMSISGTLVTFDGADDPLKFIKPIGLDEGVIRALMSGGTIMGHECIAFARNGANYTKNDCFKVNEGTNAITIPESSGFLIRVRDTLGSIYDREAGNIGGDPTAAELAFVEDTPLPVVRAAQLFSTAYPESGREMLMGYSELIAYNIALNFLEDVYQTVLEGAEGNVSADLDSLKVWKDQLQENKRVLLEKQSKLQVRFSAVQGFVAQLHEVEDRVNARVSSNLLRAAGTGN